MVLRLVALALLLALLPHAAWGQHSALRGTVVDTTTLTPLEGVQVRLAKSSDTTDVRRAVTALDGTFRFELLPAGTWSLEATRLGYAPLRRTISFGGGQQDLGTLGMDPAALELPEVVVKGSAPPAVQSADTTVFSSSAVRTHPDATAEELVAKMPGISVDNKAGTVKSNGETVQQVLVDGKPFFGMDAALALRNLPADVIDKIQVFDKLSEQSDFTGFDDGQSLKTMNVILRNDHPVTFGKAYGGGAADQRYEAGGNAHMLAGATRLSAVGISNNINQQNFSSQDILGTLNVGNQRGSAGGGGGRKDRVSRNDVNPFLVGQQDGVTTTNALGAQADAVLGNRLDVSQSYFFNRGDNHNLQAVGRQYLVPQDSVATYSQEFSTEGRTDNQRLDGRYTWKADSAVIDVPRLYFQSHHVSNHLGAESDFTSGQPATRAEALHSGVAAGDNLSNHLLLQHRFGVHARTLSLDLGFGHTLKDASSVNYSAVDQGVGPESTSDTLDQRSNLHTTSSSATAKLVYTQPVGRRGALQASLTPSVNDAQSEHHGLLLNPPGGGPPVEVGPLTNRFRSVTTSQRAGLGYQFHTKALRLTLSCDLQRTSLSSERLFPDPQTSEQSYYDVLPSVLLNDNLPNHRNLRLSLTTATRAPNITQLQDVVDNSNPLMLTMGNPNLRSQYVQTLLGRYSTTDPARSRSMFLLMSLQKTDHAIGNATWTATKDTIVQGVPLQRDVQLVTPANVVREWNANSFVTFSRPLPALMSIVSLNTGATWTRSRGLVNQFLNTTDAYALSQGIVVASNISQAVDFTLSYTGTYNIAHASLSQTRTNYLTHSASLRLNLITWKHVVMRQEVNGLANGYAENAVLWNSSLGEKLFRNQIDLRLTASDVLAQNRSTNRAVNDGYIQNTRNETVPRYIMLTATYTWGQQAP